MVEDEACKTFQAVHHRVEKEIKMATINAVAEWTGSYPCLCRGEWKLYVQGRDFSELLAGRGEMNTAGEYQSWHFEDNWMEVFESYQDGLKYPEWEKENIDWLSKVAADPVVAEEVGSRTEELYRAVYEAISEEDWRHNSCGAASKPNQLGRCE